VITTAGVVSIYTLPFCYAMLKAGAEMPGMPLWGWGLLGGLGGIWIGFEAFKIFSHKIAKFYNNLWQRGKTEEQNPHSITNFIRTEIQEPWNAQRRWIAVRNSFFMMAAGGIVVVGNVGTWVSLTKAIRDTSGRLGNHLSDFGNDFYLGSIFVIAATLIFFNTIGSGIFSAPKFYNVLKGWGQRDKRISALNEKAKFQYSTNVKFEIDQKKATRRNRLDIFGRIIASLVSNGATVFLKDMGDHVSPNAPYVMDRTSFSVTASLVSWANKIGGGSAQTGVHGNNPPPQPQTSSSYAQTTKVLTPQPESTSTHSTSHSIPNPDEGKGISQGTTSKSNTPDSERPKTPDSRDSNKSFIEEPSPKGGHQMPSSPLIPSDNKEGGESFTVTTLPKTDFGKSPSPLHTTFTAGSTTPSAQNPYWQGDAPELAQNRPPPSSEPDPLDPLISETTSFASGSSVVAPTAESKGSPEKPLLPSQERPPRIKVPYVTNSSTISPATPITNQATFAGIGSSSLGSGFINKAG
jgi:hypothetical protein